MAEQIEIGTKVTVPNGEQGVVVDAFRKDGDDRIVVEFADGSWITVSPLDVR